MRIGIRIFHKTNCYGILWIIKFKQRKACMCLITYWYSSRKLVILFVLATAAVTVLWLRGIVSVVCAIVFSKSCKPFMWDLIAYESCYMYIAPLFSKVENKTCSRIFLTKLMSTCWKSGWALSQVFDMLLTKALAYCKKSKVVFHTIFSYPTYQDL